MNNKIRIVIIGATSAIAECCAREWVKDAAVDLTLVGRDLDKTNRVAEDLRVRSPQSVIRAITADFIEPLVIRRQVDEIFAQGPVHIVLIAHGLLPEQFSCQEDLSLSHHALTVNGISPVLFAEAFAGHMQKAGSGVLAVISSVAGDRGRKSICLWRRKGTGYAICPGFATPFSRHGRQSLAHQAGPNRYSDDCAYQAAGCRDGKSR